MIRVVHLGSGSAPLSYDPAPDPDSAWTTEVGTNISPTLPARTVYPWIVYCTSVRDLRYPEIAGKPDDSNEEDNERGSSTPLVGLCCPYKGPGA
jgi:hypothetical protein